MAETNIQKPKTALALSGGGFRATLFHLGSLTRLNELAMLETLDTVSSVSGGSIIGCYLGYKWRNLVFGKNGIAINFGEEITQPIQEFCSKNIDSGPSLINIAAMLFGIVTSQISPSTEKYLYGKSTLKDLPREHEGPKFIILVSNVQTGGRVWFISGANEYIFTERLGISFMSDIPLSDIVAASAGLPPFLSPIIIITEPSQWRRDDTGTGSDLFDEIGLRERMVLTDGGIHDPTGVDPVMDNHETILVSDSSVTREVWRRPSSFWIRQTGRSTIMQTVANSESKRKLLEDIKTSRSSGKGRKIVWWGNHDRISDFMIPEALTDDNEKTGKLCEMRTRLNAFNPEEQGHLINWGYALCDAAIRKSKLIKKSESPSAKWPIPEYSL